ncbi:hypothetical protein A2456_01325 [Candidatus Nomurabacteria bacterium RIFOXYC2_FULL_36_19]|uniref:Glucose/sorbosone dehydrogenase n=3 Tax=Candidatus Nomuraibacteriota TaxID=1752729 RepID=A0A1F6YW81_9BACT|nr:MAG: hypothetical protein UR91_C0024G0008 [Candidatus Nomurabacteria bacterium GW2011_GWC2_35_8]OGJ06335.1 MAG: hypothetical protein A2238_02515 [Candidatus Nomurabacteria bacterium RIFOXYA2_FULL_35_9]OGJ06654.1 MAG: hypothetical protein A2192_01485 [Candidatus Nomurabacteria bacterium RIFOXYA1_FULL_35_17]OGJ10618.1 MAG: hypothetical protein A2456_01325 [Candidatus Nomurabacteria bacterium RIFOXYC2_FULL_36_19]OGJ13585.1 MAG: hypothetical protein A2554_02370 [Candidatus Nomurabacteria bacteri
MATTSWALKRQIFYIIVLILVISVFAFIIIFPNFNKAPSCTDGKQNGTETGIDCGGSCVKACLPQVDPVSIIWARAFRVVPGRYNAVAYLENHNINTAVNKINYKFRFADANNVYIGKREGSTFIPPTGKFVIFESAIDIGNSISVYTNFEFTQTPQWVTVLQEKINQLQILISNIVLVNEDTSPRLSATLKNNSFFSIPEMEVVVILYDENHNAVSVSSTYLESLAGEEVRQINFTWPEPFSAKIVSKEIIPLYNIFSVKLR